MNKTGPLRKYFCMDQDRGLISRKGEGSLANVTGRRGTVGSQPLDSDLAGMRSNLGPRFRIGRLLGDWGSGGGEAHRSGAPAAAGLPE